MLEIVRFEIGGQYGLRNSWTGILLPNRRGRPVRYRTLWLAKRALRRRERNFTTSMQRIAANLDKRKD